jgi:hypothetical protein
LPDFFFHKDGLQISRRRKRCAAKCRNRDRGQGRTARFFDPAHFLTLQGKNITHYIGCSIKFILKVGVEELIVNAPRNHVLHTADQLFKSNLTFCVVVFLLCRRTSGAFTIDSSTPTLRRNLNEHLIFK